MTSNAGLDCPLAVSGVGGCVRLCVSVYLCVSSDFRSSRARWGRRIHHQQQQQKLKMKLNVVCIILFFWERSM